MVNIWLSPDKSWGIFVQRQYRNQSLLYSSYRNTIPFLGREFHRPNQTSSCRKGPNLHQWPSPAHQFRQHTLSPLLTALIPSSASSPFWLAGHESGDTCSRFCTTICSILDRHSGCEESCTPCRSAHFCHSGGMCSWDACHWCGGPQVWESAQ